MDSQHAESRSVFCEVRRARKAVHKSQAEFAALLGVSTRAVQSYEQGWRPTPIQVQRTAGLLVYLNWQKDHPKQKPCWSICRCTPSSREACIVHQMNAGNLCWMFADAAPTTNGCTPEQKSAACAICPVTRDWLQPLHDEARA